MKKIDKEDNLIIRIAEYGYSHEIFSLRELIDNNILKFKLSDNGEKIYPEFDYVIRTLFYRGYVTDNPNHIAIMVEKAKEKENEKYTLLSSTYFSYLDYVELKEAREQSKAANIQSKWAIAISLISLLATVAIGVLDKFRL